MNIKKMSSSLLLVLAGLVYVSASANAADVKAGEEKAKTCAGCHGADGNSGNAQYPILAGQQPMYLSGQLKAFKDGSRKAPMMQGIAAGLSDDDIDNLSAYFTAQAPKSAGGDPQLAKQGEAKFNMCMGCHGAKAAGNGYFPRLAGQHPNYIAKQLHDFKSKTRMGGPMPAVAGNLSDDDIKALAAYVGSLN
ncbi:MAG: c-type cytochrome [Gammaproteobacteria bacterium]